MRCGPGSSHQGRPGGGANGDGTESAVESDSLRSQSIQVGCLCIAAEPRGSQAVVAMLVAVNQEDVGAGHNKL